MKKIMLVMLAVLLISSVGSAEQSNSDYEAIINQSPVLSAEIARHKQQPQSVAYRLGRGIRSLGENKPLAGIIGVGILAALVILSLRKRKS